MDCIDCHNRISHLFEHPQRAVDEAALKGRIDSDIPFIRAWAASVIMDEYESHEEANAKADGLEDWYQRNYPEYYAENQGQIRQAIEEINTLNTETTFPEMEVGWITHRIIWAIPNFLAVSVVMMGNTLARKGIRSASNATSAIPFRYVRPRFAKPDHCSGIPQ